MRLPVTAKIALATAGAIGGVPGSPSPPHLSPPDRTKCVSMHRRVRHPGDRVGVEIALLDPAVPDGDLAEQRGRQAVEHRALDLHRRGQRIDQMAAVDAGDDPLDLDARRP